MNSEIKILTPERQLAVVRETTTLPTYEKFVSEYFGNRGWLKKVRKDVGEKKIWGKVDEPNAFRLMTLSAAGAGQYGFTRLDAALGRHAEHKWNESPVSLPHATAVLLYCAQGSVDSAETKKKLIEEDPTLDPAVWGVYLYIKGGDVDTSAKKVQDMRTSALDLRRTGGRVFLPNESLNEGLATLGQQLGFDGDMADKISKKEFERDIFREVKEVTNSLTGDLPVFF